MRSTRSRLTLALALTLSIPLNAQTPALAAPAGSEAARIPQLPPADPRNFTAPSPTAATVDAFLRALWGYDGDRTWRVAGVQTTAAPGVSRVTVWVLEKAPGAEIQQMVFLVTPDGKHAIEGVDIIPFGEKPFAPTRELLRTGANGPYHGPASRDFEMVEFVDLQCPHCREAQGVMEQLARDFPGAHIATQLYPLVTIHSSAYKAAKYATCAERTSPDGVFKFMHEVLESQDSLTPTADDDVLKAAATRAGLDANALATCAASPAAQSDVDAQMRLAVAADVDQTPMLAVNGRMIPEFNSIPYEQLKTIIRYQATLDGVDAGSKPEVPASAAAAH